MWPDASSGFEADPLSPAGTEQRMWWLTAAATGRGRQSLLGQMVLLAIFAAVAALAAAVSGGQSPAFTAVSAVVAVAAAYGAIRAWRAWRAADSW